MSSPLNRLALIAYGSFAIGSFVLIILPTILVVAILPGVALRRRIARASAAAAFWVAGSPIQVTGEGLPDAAAVVVANHASYLDGIILTAALPPGFTFVIKREMSAVPLAGLLLRRLGSEFVDRENRRQRTRDARRLVKRAQAKHPMVFFPEGTFDEQPGLKAFRPGAFAAAARAGIPVIPVAICGSRAKLPASRLLPRPGPLAVHVCPPLWPKDFESAQQLAGAAREKILERLDEPDLAPAAATGDDQRRATAT